MGGNYFSARKKQNDTYFSKVNIFSRFFSRGRANNEKGGEREGEQDK